MFLPTVTQKNLFFFIFKRQPLTFHHTKYFHSNSSNVTFIEWQSETLEIVTKPPSIFEHRHENRDITFFTLHVTIVSCDHCG